MKPAHGSECSTDSDGIIDMIAWEKLATKHSASRQSAAPIPARARVCLTLPYPPSANRYWRHGVIRGQARTFLSADAKAFREEVVWRARLAGVQPLTGRVSLTVRLYPHRPQDWQRRQRKDPETWGDTVQCIDLGNAEKVLSDALNGVAWVDDKQHRRILLERCDPDDQGARVEIEIEMMTIDRPQEELLP